MTAVRITDVGHCPNKNINFSTPCTSDLLDCEHLKNEIFVLCSEIKSLTKTINVLNKERESDHSANEAITSFCNSCAQLKNKLRELEEEVSSLKLIIELLKTDKQEPQENWTTITKTKTNQDSNLTSQPNVMLDSHKVLQKEQYSVPISNRYTVLSGNSGFKHGNLSTMTH